MTIFLEQLINALALAGIYLLIALGITLIFGLTRLVFFAMGELGTLGGFVTLTLVGFKVPVPIALLVAAMLVGVVAELVDLTLLRPTLKVPLNGFIISLGLIVAFEAFYAVRWSADYYSIPRIITGTWSLGDVVVDKERV